MLVIPQLGQSGEGEFDLGQMRSTEDFLAEFQETQTILTTETQRAQRRLLVDKIPTNVFQATQTASLRIGFHLFSVFSVPLW